MTPAASPVTSAAMTAAVAPSAAGAIAAALAGPVAAAVAWTMGRRTVAGACGRGRDD